MQKLSIIIPVFNEKNTVVEVISKVWSCDIGDITKEIILVDDCSNDGTTQILKDFNLEPFDLKILYHDVNQGKGAAIRTAQAHISGDLVIIQDADLEYDPSEYKELLKPIIEGKADVVYGSRLSGGKPTRAFKIAHYFGNKFLTLTTNLLYDSTISDMETCYKVFKSSIFKKVKIKSNRFDFEPEITAKVLKQKVKLYELPISYYGRDYLEGKKITWIDGFSALWALIKYRFID